MMKDKSCHVPTVYDCAHCKHNTSLIKEDYCTGCRILNPNWMNRSRPTKYEPVVLTMTTQSGTFDDEKTD